MFVKMFNQILDSSIADNRRLRHFFMDLLLCADMQGFVIMTETAIARRIGATLEEVEWGIAELSLPDQRSKTPDADGRRIEKLDGSGYGWRIINFDVYRALKSADDMREKTKERVRRFRSKSSTSEDGNANVTQCNAGNPIQKQKQKQIQKKIQKERKEVAAPRSVVVFPENLQTHKFLAAWDEWTLHLKQKKKIPTEMAVKHQLKKCSELGAAEAIRMIEHSIAGGWQSLYQQTAANGKPVKKEAPNFQV
jgi:hypothetical protein